MTDNSSSSKLLAPMEETAETMEQSTDTPKTPEQDPAQEPASVAVESSTSEAVAPASAPEAETSAASTTTSTEAEKTPFALRLKYGLLKAIDLTALGFLEPVVRLCYGEEPQTQIKKIGRFVAIPILFVLLFLLVWDISSARIKTKTGTLPNPAEVWNGMSAIMDFDRRENEKLAAYAFTGKEREEAITAALAKVASLDEKIAVSKEALKEVETKIAKFEDEAFFSMKEEIKTKKDEFRDAKSARLSKIKEDAKNGSDKESVLAAYTAHEEQTEAEKEAISMMNADFEESKSNNKTYLELKNELKLAQRSVNALSDERMHQDKMHSILTSEGRTARTEQLAEKRGEILEEFNAATGLAVYNNARSLYKIDTKLSKASESSYAKAWTLPMQIWRSILCVFAGFFVGCAIAIPIGICCGLSKTFMAAMTPFIAVFKPVSPIVWLLIFWVVVVGFIPDPETNWFIQSLWHAPLIGWMEINPAFIASALTVAMCSLWATLVNTALGVASVDKDHLNVAKVLRLGFWSRLFKIILPSALPLMFAGMRISLGVGWMVLVAAELLAGSEGVGKFTWDMFNNNSSDSFAKIMVMVFVVGFIGLLLDRIMIIFQRMVSFEGSVAAV